jgi:hypothetical protein
METGLSSLPSSFISHAVLPRVRRYHGLHLQAGRSKASKNAIPFFSYVTNILPDLLQKAHSLHSYRCGNLGPQFAWRQAENVEGGKRRRRRDIDICQTELGVGLTTRWTATGYGAFALSR